MVLVPCGDETGVYYVIVSGLPWSATWQTLKDFVRNPTTGGTINVEHVYIYPSTTDGWVRIHGRDDFQRAYVFEGKAIVADDRNGRGIVNLRDITPILNGNRQYRSSNSPVQTNAPTSMGYCSYPSSSTGYTQQANTDLKMAYQGTKNSYQNQSSYSEGQLENYSPISKSYPESDHSQSSASFASSCSSFGLQSFDYSSPAPQGVYFGSPPVTPIYAQPLPVHVGYFIPAGMVPAVPVTQPQYQYAIADTQPAVPAEARKIIITHLPQSVTEEELQTLLERAVHKYKSRSDYPIELIEIPRHTDGKARGHAFVTFFSSKTAQRAVEALCGKTFQRRALTVRLTKEGAGSTRHHHSAREQSRPQPTTTELVTQMDQMSVGTCSSSAGTVVEVKREGREKPKPRTQEKTYDIDSERGRGSRTKSSYSTSAPAVVNGSGSGGKRRHR